MKSTMTQQTLTMTTDQGATFECYRKLMWRDEFLAVMNHIVPWAALCAVVEPHYPKRGHSLHSALVQSGPT